jgi:DNA-binding transcriptional MerR regulator
MTGIPPGKRYYSIREVSELLNEKAHVLRYWETQFPLLRPRKNRAGNRMYQEGDIDLLRSIQEMLHVRGYTIAGARAHIGTDHRQRESERRAQIDLDFLRPSDRRKLREIRAELVELREWLAGRHRGSRRLAPLVAAAARAAAAEPKAKAEAANVAFEGGTEPETAERASADQPGRQGPEDTGSLEERTVAEISVEPPSAQV